LIFHETSEPSTTFLSLGPADWALVRAFKQLVAKSIPLRPQAASGGRGGLQQQAPLPPLPWPPRPWPQLQLQSFSLEQINTNELPAILIDNNGNNNELAHDFVRPASLCVGFGPAASRDRGGRRRQGDEIHNHHHDHHYSSLASAARLA
jgi:hypothetical protein